MTKEPIPVIPAAHYCMGGVKASVNGTTDIPRLFAVGETSSTGLHGANRLASNSLLECLVCGHECGNFVGQQFQDKSFDGEVPEWHAENVREPDENFIITSNWNELRFAMQNYASIVRSEMYLLRARKRITVIHEDVDKYYWDFRITSDLIELRSLLTIARLIVESALARHESRGAHYRIDYPEKADIVRNTYMKRSW